MKKRYSLAELMAYEPRVIEFDGSFEELVGKPEKKGSWLIWGSSGNGKTSFATQLAIYFTKFCKVYYNSLEEGISKSVKDAFRRIPVESISKYRFSLLNRVSMDELKEMLRKPRSAEVVFIDSIQYTGLKYADYTRLLDEFPNKIFIFVSQEEGTKPKGEVAKSVRYDANVKIRVDKFVASGTSRFGGGKPYIVNQRKAEELGYFSQGEKE